MKANLSPRLWGTIAVIARLSTGFVFLFPQYFPALAMVVVAIRRKRIARVSIWLLLPFGLLICSDLLAGRFAAAGSLAITCLAVGVTLAAGALLGFPFVRSHGVQLGVLMAFIASLIRVLAEKWLTPGIYLAPLDPNLTAHSVVVAGALASLFLRPYLRWCILMICIITIILIGSRTALIGAALLATIWGIRAARTKAARAVLYLLPFIALGAGAAFLSSIGERWDPRPWLDQVRSSRSHNLIPGSDEIGMNTWSSSGIGLKYDAALKAPVLHKTSPEPWTRPQQSVSLLAGHTYTLSVEFKRVMGASVPGVIAQSVDHTESSLGLRGEMRGDSWLTSLSGDGEILGSGSHVMTDGWQLAWVTFQYTGSKRITVRLGPAPDIADRVGSEVAFRSLQLALGPRLLPYESGRAIMPVPGWASVTARRSYWEAGISGFLEKPLLGWGADKYEAYYRQLRESRDVVDDHPTHSHNALIQLAFEHGSLGLLALLIIVLYGGLRMRRIGSYDVLIPISVALAINVTDATLLYGGVLYPLAFAVGLTLVRASPRKVEVTSTCAEPFVQRAC